MYHPEMGVADDQHRALFDAVRANDLRAVRQALDRGADPNSVTGGRETLLMVAVHSRASIHLIRVLISRGALIESTDDAGRTALHHAALSARRDAAEILLAEGAGVESESKDGKTPLDFAVEYADDQAFVRLLRSKMAPTSAMRAATNDALFFAAARGDLAAVVELLADGADPKAPGRGGYTPLHQAATGGHAQVVSMLLARGVPANLRSNAGTTPVMSAVWSGHVDVTRLLIEGGADVNLRDSAGLTALHISAKAGANETQALTLSKLLLDAGVAPSARDRDGYTARMNAVARGRRELVALLPPSPGDPPIDVTADGIDSVVIAEVGDACLSYRPNDPFRAIGYVEGPARDPAGMDTTAAQALVSLRKQIERVGAGWFVPILTRIEIGERVAYSEVEAAFRTVHGRAPSVRRFCFGRSG